jgi:hypothetical protein
MPDKEEIQKGRFLTETQIEYLVGENDQLSPNAEGTKRSRIRDRAAGAIGDLTAVTNLGRADREELFDFDKPEPISPREPAEPVGKWGYAGLDFDFNRLVEFFYKMFRENGVPRERILAELESSVEAAEFEFRHDIERTERLEEHLRPVDVEADFQITTVGNVDLQSARERYKMGEELSGMEMKALIESGYAELQLDP